METELKDLMVQIIGEKETNEFFSKLLNLAKTNPTGFKSKVNLAKTFIK